MVIKTFKLQDMHCTNCAIRIESLEDDLLGIHSIKASYAREEMEVEYDERLIDLEKIVEAVRQLGYTAVVI